MKPGADQAVRFLNHMAQALSRVRLYDPGHPARERAVTQAHRYLQEALLEMPELPLTFTDGEVVLDDRRLEEMGRWQWSVDLARAGVERIEFSQGVTQRELRTFLQDVHQRLESTQAADRAPDTGRLPHISYGKISVREQTREFRDVGLEEEAQALRWLQEQVREDGRVDVTVARSVALGVGAAVRETGNALDLLVPLQETEEYSIAHTLNVSALSVTLADALGYRGEGGRELGEAAVLHDLGKHRVPEEILQKPGPLSEEEWEIVRQHPEEGARLLLRSDDRLDLAALVAYEHHRTWSGGGYPRTGSSSRPHQVSQLIQVCDVYDALRTRRPYREPWDADEIVRHIREGAGDRFDPRVVDVFARMAEGWELEAEEGSEGEREEEREEERRRPSGEATDREETDGES